MKGPCGGWDVMGRMVRAWVCCGRVAGRTCWRVVWTSFASLHAWISKPLGPLVLLPLSLCPPIPTFPSHCLLPEQLLPVTSNNL